MAATKQDAVGSVFSQIHPFRISEILEIASEQLISIETVQLKCVTTL